VTKELSYLFGIRMLFEELHKRLQYEISLVDGYFEFLYSMSTQRLKGLSVK